MSSEGWAPSGIDYAAELNEEQYAAVTAEPGPALVLAGAGSGKTRTLTYRVVYLRDQRIPHWQILLLTFTNKAAREMLHRVEQLTGGGFPAEWGGTFHSIGARVLRRYGAAVGLAPSFTILDEDDAEGLFAQLVKDKDKSYVKVKDNPTPKVLHGLVSYARNTRRPVESVVAERFPYLPGIVEPVGRFARAYQEAKLARQVCDYDDLLELWLELLKKDDAVRTRLQQQFKHVLVDEYQDTNLLQSEIVDLIASDHQLMAVGDDAQCIYTWRGANFENIASFPKRHPGTRIFKIQVNYRSTPPILRFANEVLRSHAAAHAGYEKELLANRNGSIKPYVVPCADTVAQARFIVDRLQGLYDEGRSLGDVCVLYRAHYQAMDLQMELSKLRVPFTITSGIRFFEQAHIRDFTAILRFLVNPGDVSAFERFVGLLPKVGPRTAQKLHKAATALAEANRAHNITLAPATEAPRGTPRQAELSLFDWAAAPTATQRDGAATRRLPDHPAAVLIEEPVAGKVPEAALEHWDQMAFSLREGVQAMTPADGRIAAPADIVRVLVEGWYGDYLRTAYETHESRREDLDALINFAANYDSLSEMLAQLVLLSSETTEGRVDDSQPKMRLSTIHQAKGLEFPVVFVIGCTDGGLPLQRAIEDGDIDEERRLFYVAVTRAEDELYLCYPQLQRTKGSLMRTDPSIFLQEIEGRHYEILRPRRMWG